MVLNQKCVVDLWLAKAVLVGKINIEKQKKRQTDLCDRKTEAEANRIKQKWNIMVPNISLCKTKFLQGIASIYTGLGLDPSIVNGLLQ